ncbi:MAG: DM13 domain-containing protein [Candidatus Peribacteraceae bacterium]|jgi:hypothetical protein|nr:DM13 domain-containing protein [Candidatus Peribacteraceae bacterium]|tara:strand:+ start:1589 stop:2173 length:585 start_codon:yes stop_codon:yes gene_type:complete
MKIRSIALITPLLLAACGGTYNPDQKALLENPLYLEQYAEQLVDAMVNLEIYEDPLLEDAAKQKVVDSTKEYWLKKAKEARKAQRKGMKGSFTTMKEYTEGEVVFNGKTVYFGPTFDTTPGPSVHAFLTVTVDPRDVQFPDITAIDLGEVKVPFGAQGFVLDEKIEDFIKYRTVVLWDTKLDRLYGFAQMTPRF